MSSVSLRRVAMICGMLLVVQTAAEPNCCIFRQQAQAQGRATSKAPSRPAAAARTDAASADRAAIRAAMESFVKAFRSRDAKALAAHWSSEGEYENDAGIVVRGREALASGFSTFFAKTPEVEADIQPDSLRFLSSDSGIEEGAVTIRRGAAEPATHARYTALFVREDGQWRLGSLRETPDDDVSIGDLAWLVGDWKSVTGGGAEIRTTYSWDANKKFLHVKFSLKEGERAC